jgi:hypothetical protein
VSPMSSKPFKRQCLRKGSTSNAKPGAVDGRCNLPLEIDGQPETGNAAVSWNNRSTSASEYDGQQPVL